MRVSRPHPSPARPSLPLRRSVSAAALALILTLPGATLLRAAAPRPPTFHPLALRVSIPLSTRPPALVAAFTRAYRHGRIAAHGGSHDSSRDADPQSLQIDWSKWPADTQNEQGGAINPQTADDSNQNIFSIFHHATYAGTGMQGGFTQSAQIVLNDAGDSVQAFWLGSAWKDAASASAWVADAATNLKSQGLQAQPCFLDNAPDCHLFILPIPIPPSGVVDLVYAVWSQGDTTGELLLFATSRTMELNGDAVGHDTETLLAAGGATVTAAGGTGGSSDPPPPAASAPTITIDELDVLRDTQGHLVRATVAHLHQLVFLVAAFHVSGIGLYTSSGGMEFYYPQSRLTVRKGSRPLFDGTADLAVAQSGELFFGSQGTIDDKSALGHLTATFTLTLSTSTDTGSKTFTLKGPVPACRKGYRVKGNRCVK